MNVLRMADQDLAGKRVLIREDLNVPVEGGRVTSDARIRASLPTIKLALEKGAKVFIASHLGRPEEGVYAEEFSLAPVAARLSELLGKPVPLKKDWLAGVDCPAGSAVLLENVRFNKGEKKDKEDLAKQMASLCDVFVMDAFGTAHRAEASTHGVGKFAKVASAGPLAGGRARGARAGARQAGAAAGGYRCWLESVDQAHGARVVAGQGGQADRGRRHREYFPRGHRRQRGQVAARSGHARHGAQAAGAGEGARCRDPAADRRGGGEGIRGHCACRRPRRQRRARATR